MARYTYICLRIKIIFGPYRYDFFNAVSKIFLGFFLWKKENNSYIVTEYSLFIPIKRTVIRLKIQKFLRMYVTCAPIIG